MIVAIHQPNFLPWLGYFHKLINSDVLVLLDDVQFPRGQSYCNRVQIKSPYGKIWLSVPVEGKSSLKNIYAMTIANQLNWKKKHLGTLQANYKHSLYFQEVFLLVEAVYNGEWTNLADFNICLIEKLCAYLGLTTRLIRSSQLSIRGSGQEHLIDILKSVGADTYLTGRGAGSARYTDEKVLQASGIKLTCQSFVHPVYTQQWGAFIPNLSIIDLLFNHGKNSLGILNQSPT